ncbi:MAG: Spx/MgsR family RNA polymerase-binding regulatory protein [Nitrospinae bacterium]|nr:Spx/MgsR family RNA polymerase-binding regulatory protein [Nitrospinota bacterium]
MKVYSYNKCGTCRNAIKDLEAKKLKFEVIDITENPPSKKILKSAVKAKGLQKVFNTSGVQYRELKIKDKIKSMTEAEAIDLLASNGRLIKRPIAVDKDKITVGFNADEYKQVWGK